MLKTNRLKLKPIAENDLNMLSEFYSNSSCTQYLPELSVSIEELVKNRIKHWNKYGFGTYSVQIKSGENIGYCGIEYITGSTDADIRYGLMESYWGNGYAKEACLAVLENVFNKTTLTKIWGAAVKENVASISVLKSIGMVVDLSFKHYGGEVVGFSVCQ